MLVCLFDLCQIARFSLRAGEVARLHQKRCREQCRMEVKDAGIKDSSSSVLKCSLSVTLTLTNSGI